MRKACCKALAWKLHWVTIKTFTSTAHFWRPAIAPARNTSCTCNYWTLSTMTEHNDSTGKIKDDIPGPQTPGQMVRAQRESAGLTLQAVSEALHLTVHYIKSLEADEYGKLPGLTFVKGYFRAYARFLKMDVDAVLAAYERHLAAKGFRQHTHDFTANQSMGSLGGLRSDQSVAWALVAGVILVIALAAGWWFFGREMEVAIANGSSAPPTQTTAPATTTTPA